jgi:N6-L-threonylcarbamoyladenine synthase
MIGLAIETSCDETSLAIFETKDISDQNYPSISFLQKVNSVKILSSIISSQIQMHAKFGGVVPELGAREHAEQIHALYLYTLNESKIDLKDLTYIAVTSSPGLKSALKVGIEFAKSLKYFLQKKYNNSVEINYVDHLQGHVASCFYQQNSELIKLKDNQIFPHLHLLVSGGNTQLRVLNSWQDYKIIGQTLDDAVGEAFDKAGRMIGLKYPAGAMLDKIAGNNSTNSLSLPISMLQKQNCDFSLSGLKTAVRYKIQKANIPDLILEKPLTEYEIEQLLNLPSEELNQKLAFTKKICESVQVVILKQIQNKINFAIQLHNPKSIGISGGVSASKKLQQLLSQNYSDKPIFIPEISLTGDNAIMIALTSILDI